jgi:putative copper resistance protein D
MAELINIILRLALYVDLLLLFGVALFALYSVNAPRRFKPLLRGLALLGALLSVAGLLLMTSAMSGETELAALWPHLQMMLLETDVGLAWALRMIALIVVLVQPGKWLASMAGAVALSSLAWSGHGAMDEGWLRLCISSATSFIYWRRGHGWAACWRWCC